MLQEDELMEALADKEHASWSRWMAYIFECAEATYNANGTTSLALPTQQVNHWRRLVRSDYADLSEAEKQSDRDEVAHILPIIRRYVASRAGVDRFAEGLGQNRLEY